MVLLMMVLAAAPVVERYGVFEAAFEARGEAKNPYVEMAAVAKLTGPAGRAMTMPLFWDGGKTWRLRVSPDAAGQWRYRVESADGGLNGRGGGFECVESKRRGGLRVAAAWPSHFERQDGTPEWFLGDTAWGYFTDSPEDRHHREHAEYYARTRAGQGFNVIHSMLMSEQGVGNQNGPPFHEISAEKLNPAYWREVDERLKYANGQGLTVGLALAWADKRKVEPWAWRRFPSVEARKRYARYIAARYGAYDVYFLVSGEWHAEVRTRENAREEEIFREFVAIGGEVRKTDPHGRMVGIHPMTRHGSVREFHGTASWMSFADYQQNYEQLHARALLSRRLRGPVVNSEYGYHLRDSDGDGKPDKGNSLTTADIRHASWDIVMAGGYLVTGFGTTYFAGHRDPGPFDVDAAKNDDWEAQIGHLRKLFTGLNWWRLIPADELVRSTAARSGDRREAIATEGRPGRAERPPRTTYWAMAEPGRTYVVYARGMTEAVELDLGARAGLFGVKRFNPRTGEVVELGESRLAGECRFVLPDEEDWVVMLERRE